MPDNMSAAVPSRIPRNFQWWLLSTIRLRIFWASSSVSRTEPELSITKWDRSHFLLNDIWLWMRFLALASLIWLRSIRRAS